MYFIKDSVSIITADPWLHRRIPLQRSVNTQKYRWRFNDTIQHPVVNPKLSENKRQRSFDESYSWSFAQHTVTVCEDDVFTTNILWQRSVNTIFLKRLRWNDWSSVDKCFFPTWQFSEYLPMMIHLDRRIEHVSCPDEKTNKPILSHHLQVTLLPDKCTFRSDRQIWYDSSIVIYVHKIKSISNIRRTNFSIDLFLIRTKSNQFPLNYHFLKLKNNSSTWPMISQQNRIVICLRRFVPRSWSRWGQLNDKQWKHNYLQQTSCTIRQDWGVSISCPYLQRSSTSLTATLHP